MNRTRVGPRNRAFGRVSKRMAEMSYIKVTCGSVRGRLHKNKFYCPGIHRECIEYQGRFITPKMFSVMGDKERLKDWKNAVRINGIQMRKYIESGTLDFYRHDEFCTGRCIARSPVARTSQGVPATATGPGLVPKVEFVSSINEHTYCHLPDDGEENNLPNIPTVEIKGEPEPVDIKPNLALLQSLLEKPPTTSVDVLPSDVAAAFRGTSHQELEPEEENDQTADEDRQFWIGIMELGLLEHFFREIKITLDVMKSDLVTHHVKTSDAVRISNVVRTMGLMKKFKNKLASFKSDMDQQQAKIDAEMEALKQRVNQYELRKQALKRKSEKFEQLMDMSAKKKTFIIEKNVDNSDEDGEREVVDVCYENDEYDDDDNSGDHDGEEEPENEEKTVTLPGVSADGSAVLTTSVQSLIRPISPVKITTLPSTSNCNFIIKNNESLAKVSLTSQKTEPVKKVTLVRQVLMETGNDGETIKMLKESSLQKLKEALTLQSSNDPKETVKSGSASLDARKPSSSLPSSTPSQHKAVAKGKVKIIARCKPKTNGQNPPEAPKSSPVNSVVPDVVTSKTSSSVSLVSEILQHKDDPSKIAASLLVNKPVPKNNPTQLKKKKPKPLFEVDFGNLVPSSTSNMHTSQNIATFDTMCQTPIDGVREVSNTVTNARRSNRKTAHMFSWGVKAGNESNTDSTMTPVLEQEVVVSDDNDIDQLDEMDSSETPPVIQTVDIQD